MEIRGIIRNASHLISAQIISKILYLIQIIILSRYLGTKGLGIYSFIFSFGLIFVLLSDLGLDEYIIRLIARNKNKTDVVLGNVLVIKGLLFLIFIPIMMVSLRLFSNQQDIIQIAYLYVIYYFLHVLSSTNITIFRAFEVNKYEAIVILLRDFIIITLNMVFLISGYGIAHIFLGFIVGTMVGFIVGSIIVLKKITKPIFIIQISKWKNWFKDSFGFLANSLMLLLILKLSMLILIKYHPIEAVGLFGSVMAVIENSITLFVLLGITSYPVFSRLFIKSKLELIKTYKQVRNYAVIGGLLATLALLIFTVPIIKILFGQEFLGAVMGLRILSIGIIFFFLNSLNKFFLFGINKQMYNIRILSAVLLITIILGFAIIPTYGFIGAIFTSLISQAVLFLLQYLYISRNITN